MKQPLSLADTSSISSSWSLVEQLKPSKMVKKGSWLSTRSRSGRFLSMERSQTTNAIYFKRILSIKNHKKGKKSSAAADEEKVEAREVEETQRGGADNNPERFTHPPESASHIVQHGEAEDDDDDDESYLNQTDIYIDRYLHSLGPFEKRFISNVITDARIKGCNHPDSIDNAHAIGMLLRDICAYEKPFESLQTTEGEDDFMEQQGTKKLLNVDPLLARMKHSLSQQSKSSAESALVEGAGSSTNNINMTPAQMQRLVCSVLREMNVNPIKPCVNRSGRKVVTTAADKNKTDASPWGNPPFMNSWNSLSFCHCSIF